MPNFKDLLFKLKKEGEAIDFPVADTKPISGSYSTTRFVKKQIGGTTVQLAISESQKTHDENDKAIPKVQQLLIERGVDMQFILNYLYYDGKGKKISFHAPEGSLGHYVTSNQNQITRDQVKKIMGQLILGLQALHQKNLVHRDLQQGNILVTQDKTGHLFVQICDLDTVIPVNYDGTIEDKANIQLLGGSLASPELLPLMTNAYSIYLWNDKKKLSDGIKEQAKKYNTPILIRTKEQSKYLYSVYRNSPQTKKWEMCDLEDPKGHGNIFLEALSFEKNILPYESEIFKESNSFLINFFAKVHDRKLYWQWTANPATKHAYKLIDLKAADCYAVGKILQFLLTYAEPSAFTKLEKDSLLGFSFCNKTPHLRNNIQSAYDQEFFGATKEERDEFFDGLRSYPSPYEFIGQYRARAFDKDNNFLLISLNEIISCAEKLSSQFDFFDSIEKDMLEKIPAEMVKCSLDNLEKTLEAFNSIYSILQTEWKLKVEPLQEKANEKVAEIKQKFKPELRNYKKEFEDLLIGFEKMNIRGLPENIFQEIRDAVRDNLLPEQNLPLLIEWAYAIVFAIKYPENSEYIERLGDITKKLPVVFPEFKGRLSQVWLFAEKQVARVSELGGERALEFKFR